jgi:hypothetical protein
LKPTPPSLPLVLLVSRALPPGGTSCTFNFASVMSLPDPSPAVFFMILVRPPGFDALRSVTSAISR